jgi:hypothetical protein
MKPGQYLARLVERRLYADAVRYMAFALLNREAVWWTCLCARSETDNLQAIPLGEQHALGAAVRWVLEPSEARRKQAQQSALAVSATTPAGAAARAASFALGQTDAPRAGDPPPDRVQAARLAASSVLLGAGRGPTAAASARLRRFITLGLDVAYGNNRWD